ncbi:MAG: YtxH domain-containing protein [Vulcanimicrobiaceae bacterium]
MTGLLTGALVGAAVGLLVAPQSGDETRGRLRESAGDASDRVRAAAGDLSVGASGMYTRGKHLLSNARTQIDAAVDEAKTTAASERARLDTQS